MAISRIVKPKNQRVKRALEKRDPKLVENDKNTMVIKGGHTSNTVSEALKDLYALKKPLAVMFKKKNIMRPFEDQTSIEFFSSKTDASLFIFGSHSKKRPHNLVLGRLYDSHILDMVELGIENYKPMSHFKVPKCPVGTKPCLIFAGDPFEQDHEHRRLKNLLIDLFRGPVVKKVRLVGLEHMMSFTASEGKIYVRSYKILLKKSGSRVPRIELEEMGPSLDLVMRRTKLASDDLYKRARKVPKAAKPKKVKNMSLDPFGTKHAQIHMTKQDIGSLQLRKVKALKRKTSKKTGEVSSDAKKSKPSEPMEQH